VAKAFFEGIVRLHGLPQSIVTDRDPVFTWCELFKLSASHELNLSPPRSDGQTEFINKIIAMCLRCLAGDRPWHLVEWLPWAEFYYNTSYHSAIRATPFEVVYG
jgi:hypothetical protein